MTKRPVTLVLSVVLLGALAAWLGSSVSTDVHATRLTKSPIDPRRVFNLTRIIAVSSGSGTLSKGLTQNVNPLYVEATAPKGRFVVTDFIVSTDASMACQYPAGFPLERIKVELRRLSSQGDPIVLAEAVLLPGQPNAVFSATTGWANVDDGGLDVLVTHDVVGNHEVAVHVNGFNL